MGLQFIGATDLVTFIDAVQLDQGLPEFAPMLPSTATGSPHHTYLHQLDKTIIITREITSGFNQRFGMNPLLAGTGFPDAFYEGGTGFADEIPMIPGDPLSPGGQRLYSSEGGVFPGSEWEEVTPVTSLTNTGVGAWPTVPAGNGPIRVTLGIGTAIPPGPGTWNAGSLGSVLGIGFYMLIFEGLTEGIPGETNLTGPGSYPAGLALLRCRLGTCPAPIGTGAANDCDRAFVWLDLATGLLDGRMPTTPGAADTSGINTEAPIAGETFDWQAGQYIPDSDSTFTAPKGEMMIVSDDPDSPADPANFTQSAFVKMIDFNPFNVVESGGAPPRVHERVRLLSSCDYNDDPMYDVPGAGAGGGTGFNNEMIRLQYHPPSRRFFQILAVAVPTLPNVAGEAFIGYWARAVAPSVLTSPVARTTPRTNDITEFEAFTLGTLGEPAGGVTINWSLFRNSTELEVIDASTFPGTSTVANFPIDDSSPSTPEGTLVVRADTVVLVEGVDYTVVLATGVITWITDQSGATVVDASYEHRETNATPPHGDLLSTVAVSDEEGRVNTQVAYGAATTLVGAIDRLINAFA